MKNYNNFNEILNLTITSNNSIAFKLSDFNLPTLYNELLNFHTSYELDNKLFFAYPFNENGLLSKKCYINVKFNIQLSLKKLYKKIK